AGSGRWVLGVRLQSAARAPGAGPRHGIHDRVRRRLLVLRRRDHHDRSRSQGQRRRALAVAPCDVEGLGLRVRLSRRGREARRGQGTRAEPRREATDRAAQGGEDFMSSSKGIYSMDQATWQAGIDILKSLNQLDKAITAAEVMNA